MRELSKEELKIGNFITDQFGEVCTVDAIDENHVFNTEIGDIPIYCCMPIPLTEGWLISFGFKKNTEGFYLRKVLAYGYISVYWIGDILGVQLIQERGYTLGNLNIKHIHQLQNIYFALCGEELKIEKS